MLVEEALIAQLATKASVTGLVRSRIYPGVIPAGVAFPAIRYTKVSAPREQTLEGPAGLAFPRLQLDCLARTKAQAARLAEALRNALDGEMQMWWGGDETGVWIEYVELVDEGEVYDDATDTDEGQLFGHRLDLVIAHREGAPTHT
jgi:hypothetical protein